MKYTHYPKRDAIKNYFPMPNEIFNLGLRAGEIALYAFLLKCEGRKTFKCWPSYKTISKALNISKNTVKTYVDKLCKKQLIEVEYTYVYTKNGKKQNGNLMYTIRPIQEAINYDLEKQFVRNALEIKKTELEKKFQEYMKEKMNEFSADIGEAPDGFAKAFVDLKFSLNGYTGRNNYQFISREQKEKVDAVVKIVCKDENLQDLYRQWCQVQLALLKYYRKDPEECFDSLENNLNLQRRLENIVLRAAIYDNKKNDLYTDKEQAMPTYGGIVFAICKMFEQSIDYDIKEGFTKSIVDSKERTKEYRRDASMCIHHGM